MKYIILFNLFLLMSFSLIRGQIQMDVLNLRISGIVPSPPKYTVENGDTIITITEGDHVVPFLAANIRLRNNSDSCIFLNFHEGSIIMTYNDNSIQYKQELYRSDIRLNNIRLNSGEDFIFEVKGFFLEQDFLDKNKGRYEEFKNYSYLLSKISPTFKFYYYEKKKNLKFVNNEILNE